MHLELFKEIPVSECLANINFEIINSESQGIQNNSKILGECSVNMGEIM